MKIAICGMSGFVGKRVESYFVNRGDKVIGLRVRSTTSIRSLVEQMDNADVIINLAGANILGRWSEEYKTILRQSRLETTQKLVEALKQCSNPPSVWLNASAVGIYDAYHQHDESSHHYGDDFLTELARDWENSAMKAQSDLTRVCIMRFGVVYGREGGAMKKMLPPFSLGFGGKIGDGFQMVSWIHLEDLVRAISFLIEHKEIRGIINFTSPEPITNLEQTKIMGRILHRPTFLDIPAWVVKLVFGEGSVVMLDSKEVYPRVLQESGFEFKYPTFDSAMEQIAHGRG